MANFCDVATSGDAKMRHFSGPMPPDLRRVDQREKGGGVSSIISGCRNLDKDKFMDFEQRAKRYSTQVDNTNNHDRLRTNKHLVLLGSVVTFLLGYTEIK